MCSTRVCVNNLRHPKYYTITIHRIRVLLSCALQSWANLSSDSNSAACACNPFRLYGRAIAATLLLSWALVIVFRNKHTVCEDNLSHTYDCTWSRFGTRERRATRRGPRTGVPRIGSQRIPNTCRIRRHRTAPKSILNDVAPGSETKTKTIAIPAPPASATSENLISESLKCFKLVIKNKTSASNLLYPLNYVHWRISSC